MTTAKRIAWDFGNDGTNYEAMEDGRSLDDVARECGAEVQHGDGSYQEEEDRHIDPSWTRYLFNDGSAIVDCGIAWDIEGSTPWSWEGAE